VRLAAALPRLAAGEAVARIAVDLGYQTPSAFSAMFRRLTGSTPSRYFALSDSA
ncbi:helix-turn-helix domain-containing protein, partial [Pseudomonas aeruginosa]|nr:helix-turn-helix domain-containing protein [Pseudomonas aeruginosa]